MKQHSQRPWIKDVLSSTSDPERAWTRWMSRDAGFAHWLEFNSKRHDVRWYQVDGQQTLGETEAMFIVHFTG